MSTQKKDKRESLEFTSLAVLSSLETIRANIA